MSLYDANRDIMGNWRSAQRTFVFNSTSAYDGDPLLWQTITSGAGNGATWDSTLRAVKLTLGGTAAGFVIRQTYQYIPYQTARAQEIFLTGIPGAPVAGVTRRWGAFDNANGLFYEQHGDGALFVGVRNAGEDTLYPRGDWGRPQYDGAGADLLDLSKDQFSAIEYAWLGIVGARWGLHLNDALTYVEAATFANKLARSFMQTAFLPLRYEIRCDAPAAAEMIQICTAVASSGGFFDQPGMPFEARRGLASPVVTTAEVPIVAIRPALTFGGIANRAFVRLLSASVAAITASVDWRMLYYPPGSADPVTGGAWVSANDDSVVETNVSGTAIAHTTGAIEFDGDTATTSGAGGTARGQSNRALAAGYPFALDYAATGRAYFVLAGIGAGASAAGRLRWEEIR